MGKTTQPIIYGAYELFVNEATRMVIRRQDADRKRTVAFVDSLMEWDRFVAALKDGADEVAAVHAIDERQPTTKGERRARAYAARFSAETLRYEPPQPDPPTDENLARRLQYCQRPPRDSELGLIRRIFLTEFAEAKEAS